MSRPLLWREIYQVLVPFSLLVVSILDRPMLQVNFGMIFRTISPDTILTEYDETLEKYVGANIAMSSIPGVPPNDFRGVNIGGLDLSNYNFSNILFDSSTIFSTNFFGAIIGANLSSGRMQT